MSTPVSGSAEESNTVSWRDPIGASSFTTAVNGAGVFVGTPGVPAPGVHVRVGVPVGTSVPAVGGVVGGRVGVRVAVGTVGRGVVGPGVGRVAVGLVGRGVAVATGVDCAPVQVPDGQSALPVHVYPANWPPTQTFPVDRHCEPGHWSSRRQEYPWFCPPTQTCWLPVHGLLPAQLNVGSQDNPENVPPLQVFACAEQLPLGQSQGKPSSVPPSQTPCTVTHTPPGQSAAVSHGAPSCEPAEHRNSPVGCAAAFARNPMYSTTQLETSARHTFLRII